MTITCCRHCKPPRRNGGCHISCPEYKEQKAKHDAEREEVNRKKVIEHNLYTQREEAIKKTKRPRRYGGI